MYEFNQEFESVVTKHAIDLFEIYPQCNLYGQLNAEDYAEAIKSSFHIRAIDYSLREKFPQFNSRSKIVVLPSFHHSKDILWMPPVSWKYDDVQSLPYHWIRKTNLKSKLWRFIGEFFGKDLWYLRGMKRAYTIPVTQPVHYPIEHYSYQFEVFASFSCGIAYVPYGDTLYIQIYRRFKGIDSLIWKGDPC